MRSLKHSRIACAPYENSTPYRFYDTQEKERHVKWTLNVQGTGGVGAAGRDQKKQMLQPRN